ncbi:hypothetical protein Drose_30830 [Dactylosporangium roseum]|uniref:RAMA domain-containing protein n=1 Tax=Dactylosporangium roseum TaxID=47989 RepID=A0ABY5Z0C9_9ACTN|nr:hypothetical protein [Dactylosporangium roseum]UWZ35484.1 hypothetical protein Drose_30830 [Dactylosporangium roseum]
MRELRDGIKQSVERLERFRRHPQRLGEQNTKASLIEPIIDALGWDVYDPDEVHREYRRRTTDNPVDYALLLLRTPRLFIEAKGLGENLDDPRWANQTISYAAVAGVEWVALTDGAEWRVYNAHAPVPIEQKLFRAVRVDSDPEVAMELLSLLSKENMRENRIEEMWKSFFVDRQVYAELTKLFAAGEPAADLVELLDRRLPKLNGDAIRSSLARARATFDFPVAASPLFPTSVDPAEVSSSPAPTPVGPTMTVSSAARSSSAPRRRVGPEERKLRVSDLIAAGRLRPGAILYGDYLGITYRAELLGDGSVRYGGQVHKSLSAAGAAVKTEVRGQDAAASVIATDGMDFWRAEDSRSGDVVTIKEIRRRIAHGA